ncbi:MAG: FecCD family ABC transporter permease [Bacillota bacterium]
MNLTPRDGILIGLLFVLLVVTIIIAVQLGATSISWSSLWQWDFTAIEQTIIFQIRLPRIILAALVGSALATSGVTFQGLFKNSMADPYVIGISAGASLGAAIAINYGFNTYYYGISLVSLFAFAGALLTVIVVYKLAEVGGQVPVGTLLLAGIALSFFLSALVSLLMILNHQSLEQVVHWLMGSLSASNWQEVKMVAPIVILGWWVIYYFATDLNIMLLGDEAAHYLGVTVTKVKVILLVTASLLTGIVVSVSGVIGFIGLIVPHILRLLVGPNHRILLVTAAVVGGIFLIIADTLARTILAPTEIPVGIITALCGAPFFIYLLEQKKVRF